MLNKREQGWLNALRWNLNRGLKINNPGTRIELGWREWVGLPQLGIHSIKAKVDTGARTSTLHASEVEEFEFDGKQFVRFKVHPRQGDEEIVVECMSQVIEKRVIRDSSGNKEARWVIETEIHIGDCIWPAEVTLTNRANMKFRMSLGRTAFAGRAIIDPGLSFVQGRRKNRVSTKRQVTEQEK